MHIDLIDYSKLQEDADADNEALEAVALYKDNICKKNKRGIKANTEGEGNE